MTWLFDRQRQHDGDRVLTENFANTDLRGARPHRVEANAGGAPMTSAIARKVVQTFKQRATFTTTFEPLKLEMLRKW